MRILNYEDDDDSMNCCGVAYVSGFGSYNMGPGTNNDRDIVADLTQATTAARQVNKTMIIATTTSNQPDAARQLKDAGFERDTRAYARPTHGNAIILWTKRIVEG